MKTQAKFPKVFTLMHGWLKSNLAGFLILIGLLSFHAANAQTHVSVNISSQPLWGPVDYDYVEYYYLPEPDVFYYVPTREFIYWNGRKWIYAVSLPPAYHVDLYRTYKVVVNHPKPYLHHVTYVTKYGKYKTVYGRQVVIRDSPDQKYYVVKGHPGKGAKSGKPNKSKGKVKS